jgi:prepilin-type N-terminal cleavage/methylation domain-containing protein
MNKNKKGFTLIELLVVVAIMSILSSMILVSLGPSREKARDSRRGADIRQMSTAMEMCYDDSSCGASEAYITADTIPSAIGSYLTVFPEDPLGSSYGWVDNLSDNQSYCVYASLEQVSGTNPKFCVSENGAAEKVMEIPTLADCCGL